MLQTTIETKSRNKPIIQRTWLSTQKAVTLVIAKELAIKYDLTRPSHIILEGTPEGILIRKLNIKEAIKLRE